MHTIKRAMLSKFQQDRPHTIQRAETRQYAEIVAPATLLLGLGTR